MRFNRYIPIPVNTGLTDPLGFLQPGSALADLLFHQFTVLSNHPGYLGFFCFGVKHLQKVRGRNLRHKGFADGLRKLEVPWGMISLRAEQAANGGGPGILNINRLKRVNLKDGEIFLMKDDRYDFFSRLGYGTLGHYHGPAVRWGLLSKRYGELTPVGERLADAWGRRGGDVLPGIAAKCGGKGGYIDFSSEEYAPCALRAEASEEEKAIWRNRIEAACVSNPVTAPLWRDPPGSDLLSRTESPEEYQTFFPGLRERYHDCDNLLAQLELCRDFECISSIIQMVFEWDYRKKLFPESALFATCPWESLVVPALEKPIARFIAGRSMLQVVPCWKVPERLAACRNATDVSRVVLEIHHANQKRKSAAPFMDESCVLISGRYSLDSAAEFRPEDVSSPEQLLSLAAWRYRRNWFFHTQQTWLKYWGDVHA